MASHYHHRIEKVPMPADVEMFRAYLKRAGYYTTNNSKEEVKNRLDYLNGK